HARLREHSLCQRVTSDFLSKSPQHSNLYGCQLPSFARIRRSVLWSGSSTEASSFGAHKELLHPLVTPCPAAKAGRALLKKLRVSGLFLTPYSAGFALQTRYTNRQTQGVLPAVRFHA